MEIPKRLIPLFKVCSETFLLGEPASVARPLGADMETCQLAKELISSLPDKHLSALNREEQQIVLMILELMRREISAEFHQTLRDLQKNMAEIIMAKNARTMEKLAGTLVKEAEKASAELRSVIKKRGELLDECDTFIKKFMAEFGVTMK